MILCDTTTCVREAAGVTGRKHKVYWCDEHDPRVRPTYEGWREATFEDQHSYGVCGTVTGHAPPRICESKITWIVMGRTQGCRAPYRFCDRHAEIEKQLTTTA